MYKLDHHLSFTFTFVKGFQYTLAVIIFLLLHECTMKILSMSTSFNAAYQVTGTYLALKCLLNESVQFSLSIMSDSLRPHGLQQARLPCPSPTPRTCSNSCPLSQWCHPTVSSSVIPFYSCLQSFPASGYFPVSWFFASGGQSIAASASVLPANIQG